MCAPAPSTRFTATRMRESNELKPIPLTRSHAPPKGETSSVGATARVSGETMLTL